MSMRPTAVGNGSGHVNTISRFSPGARRSSVVAEEANALPAGSNTTAANDGVMTLATEVFSTIAASRGTEAVDDMTLLLMERTPAALVMRSHTGIPVNSK